jgi:hypothetical protein
VDTQERAVLLTSKLSFGLAMLLWATLAVGQNNLGELLDAGATTLSAEEFRRDLVGRPLAGLMPGDREVEIVYTINGDLHGSVFSRRQVYQSFTVDGSWTTGESETICTSWHFETTRGGFIFPKRCQFWFKLGDKYFVSDSDSDRSMPVLRRTPTR